MTIETKYELESKHLVEIEGGTGAFLIRAMSIRINSKNDIRRIYDGTLYQHGQDGNGKILRWHYQRPWSLDEEALEKIKVADKKTELPATEA